MGDEEKRRDKRRTLIETKTSARTRPTKATPRMIQTIVRWRLVVLMQGLRKVRRRKRRRKAGQQKWHRA